MPQGKNKAGLMDVSTYSESVVGTVQNSSSTLQGMANQFPPEYKTIRAVMQNNRAEKIMGKVGSVVREKGKQGQHGSFVVEEDDRANTVRNFHIPSMKRNSSLSACS